MDEKRILDSKKMLAGKSDSQLRFMISAANMGDWSAEAVEAARRILGERGALQRKKPALPRLLGIVILLGGIFAAFQGVRSLTFSEEEIMLLTRAYIEAQKDEGTLADSLKNASDERIDQFLETNRQEIVREGKKQGTKLGLIKVGLAMFLFIIAWGVLTLTPNPTRKLAPIAGILLLVVAIFQFKAIIQELKSLKYVEKLSIVLPDYGWSIMLPLTAIACLIAPLFIKTDDITSA